MKQLNDYQFNVVQVSPDQITTDAGTQMREKLDQTAIEDYKQSLKGGIKLPPMMCLFDGSSYFLFDGFHRYWASKNANLDLVTLQVADGSLQEAKLLACMVNQTHGVRRTPKDKRNAVMHFLTADHSKELSNRKIAELLGVSHTFVASLREPELATLPDEEPPAEPKSINKPTPREHEDPEEGKRPQSPKDVPDKQTTAATNSLKAVGEELAATIRGVLEPEPIELCKQAGLVLVDYGERLIADGEI